MEWLNRWTSILEKYKVWLEVVLYVALTFASVMISFASYRVAARQAALSEETAAAEDMEKHPYFSIENRFIEADGEYEYIIKNTGGESRYESVYLWPILYVERHENARHTPLQRASIELPGFYRAEDVPAEEGAVFAFRDYLFSENDLDENMYPNSSSSILADDLFRYYASWDNIGDMDTSMSAEIIYTVQVSYVNYKNEYNTEWITLHRSSDSSGKADGNPILSPGNSEKYRQKDSAVYSVDSFNLSASQIRQECEALITNLRKDFGQTAAAEKYREETYGVWREAP